MTHLHCKQWHIFIVNNDTSSLLTMTLCVISKFTLCVTPSSLHPFFLFSSLGQHTRPASGGLAWGGRAPGGILCNCWIYTFSTHFLCLCNFWILHPLSRAISILVSDWLCFLFLPLPCLCNFWILHILPRNFNTRLWLAEVEEDSYTRLWLAEVEEDSYTRLWLAEVEEDKEEDLEEDFVLQFILLVFFTFATGFP